MTLILTSLTPHGIVMGSDSMMTTIQPGLNRPIIETIPGYRKIYQIPSIHAGVSCWGRGWIDEENLSSNEFWIGRWISENEGEYSSIQDFVNLLQIELNRRVNPLEIPMNMNALNIWRYGNVGAHVAGLVELRGRPVPTLYHVHNGMSERFSDIDPREVNANHDLPPDQVTRLFDGGIWPLHRNGDFWMYAVLDSMLGDLFRNLQRVELPTGDMFELPSVSNFGLPLPTWSRYLAFWIGLVRDILRLSNHPNSIGGEIQILNITIDGELREIPIENPREILNSRLSSGEISIRDYEMILSRISNGSSRS